MEQSNNTSTLERIWSSIDTDNLTCCQCNKPIGKDEILSRTFTVESRLKSRTDERTHSDRIEVPSLTDAIIVYHRHLECLLKFEKYAAVSHVWHPGVASLQYERDLSGPTADELAQLVLEQPIRIFKGLDQGNLPYVDDEFELWHDYISVPQWQKDIKSDVIQAIPEIYNQAVFVLVDFHDVEASAVEAMRHGKSIRDRACGISDICNAKYWSRMWTAMEFSKSKKLVPMLKDHVLLEPNERYETLMQELEGTWDELGEGKSMEVMIGIGNNLCPWQIGGLTLARDLNLRGKATAFANAYDFLSRRCVTNPRDFFHAILAILRLPITESDLPEDDGEALLQVARECLRRGDPSPLLMAPQDVYPEPNEAAIRSWGFVDLRMFSLGAEEMPALHKNIEFSNRNPVITAEYLGEVSHVPGGVWGWEDNMGYLTYLFEWAFMYHGVDVEAFVHTIGERLYGQPFDQIMQRLSQDGRLQILEDYLYDLSHKTKRWKEEAKKIANALRISKTKTPIDWKARARQLADVLGLSNSSLKSTVGNPRSPIDWLSNHGYTIHLGEALTMRIAAVTCPKCSETFLIRVAPYSKDVSKIDRAKVYRIPGLKFGNTLAGGTGLLIKDGRTVGRFIWGTPTCACEKLEKVEVRLDTLPLPAQNTLEYGVDRTRTSYYLVGRGIKVELG